MAINYLYDRALSDKGWFSPTLTAPGWFSRDLGETAVLVSQMTVVGHTADPSSPTATAMGQTMFAKKVTLVAGDYVAGVAAYVDYGTPGDTWALYTAILSDNSGDPGTIQAIGTTKNLVITTSLGVVGAARWLHAPLGFLVPSSGDYWIAVQRAAVNAGTGDTRIYHEGAGTDRTWSTGGQWMSDWDYSGNSSKTTTSNDFLLRGLVY